MKKVRGYKKYLNRIQNSINEDSELDIESLKREKFFNFEFSDWYGAKIGLRRKGRRFVLENLLQIHEDWELKLKELDCNFYLAIWLYDPRLEQSEVVCAINSKIDYYENQALLDSKKAKGFVANKFEPFNKQLNNFNWTRKADLEPTYQWEIEWPKESYVNEKEYFSDQRFYRKLKENAFHVIERESGKIYFQEVGDIWVGKK